MSSLSVISSISHPVFVIRVDHDTRLDLLISLPKVKWLTTEAWLGNFSEHFYCPSTSIQLWQASEKIIAVVNNISFPELFLSWWGQVILVEVGVVFA